MCNLVKLSVQTKYTFKIGCVVLPNRLLCISSCMFVPHKNRRNVLNVSVILYLIALPLVHWHNILLKYDTMS